MVVDIIVGIILVGSAIISFLRGFIREVLTIFGIVGGMVAGYIGGPLLVPQMSAWLGIVPGEEPKKLFDVVPYEIVAQILSYGSVFLGFAIILSIISHVLSEGASKIGLGALDRTLGVAFGLARGILVLGLLYLPVMYLTSDETKAQWFAGSKTHVYLEATATWISAFIPKEATEKLQENAKKAQEANDTRKKLQDIGMLPDGSKKEKELKPEENKDFLTPPPVDSPDAGKQQQNKEGKDGYPVDFRNKMNDLIEQTTTDQKPKPNE